MYLQRTVITILKQKKKTRLSGFKKGEKKSKEKKIDLFIKNENIT